MELTRSEIILILGLTAFAFRIVPQIYFAGQKFPESLGSVAALSFICASLRHHLDDAVYERRELRIG